MFKQVRIFYVVAVRRLQQIEKHVVTLFGCFIMFFQLRSRISNSVLAQIELSQEIFDEMRESLPHELPESVTQCENGQTSSPKLKNHPRFENEQVWYLSAKKSGAPSRCSSCEIPKQIKIGDLHLYVEGLLYLEKDDRVVETKLQFCLKRKCVTNINSSYNNIRPLNLYYAIKKRTFIGKL